MSASSPIADLSYRNYDGPLSGTDMRWWVIAKSTMLTALKKRSIWVAMSFSAWYYVAMIFVLYFVDQAKQMTNASQSTVNYASTLIWKDQFLIGFSYGQIMYLVIALIVGAGAIANDNRSNALLVYLSKPCTKADYIIGKWMGIFITLFSVMAIPALMFFFYGVMSYREEGFFYDDRWMILQLLLVLLLSSALYASLTVGISSLFRQGRIAGATFAGLYFISNFFTVLMSVAYAVGSDDGGRRPHRHHQDMGAAAHAITGNLSYLSVDGINIAMAKSIFVSNGSIPFGLPGNQPMVPHPNWMLMVPVVLIISAISLFVAWTRIRAVEVVG